MKKRKRSQAKPVPLLTMKPAEEEAKPRSSHSKRQLQLVTTTPFRLPDDWFVEEKRRPLSNTSNPGRIDKYYIEPGTGLKFRSLPAVQRYLTKQKIETPTKKLNPRGDCNCLKYEGKILVDTVNLQKQITPCTTRNTSSFILPHDWEIVEKPRGKRKYCGVIDKTYIEPGTGQRFRSLKAVERYVTEVNASAPLTALIPANESSPSSGSGSRKTISLDEILSQKVVSSSLKKNIPGKNDRPSKLKFGSPPAKVTWVLAGRGGNMWNPFIDDSKVPDSAKQKWSDTFVSSIYAGIISAPSS